MMEKSEDDRESAVERQATVSRRAFVGAGVLGGAAALTGMRFPGIAAAGLARRESVVAEVAYTPGEFELEDATIAELQEGMRSGKYTSRKLVELYLQRIDELDQAGPRLNQVLETNPDAIEIADALDRERKSKGARGPLHGIPILLKDNIATADRMATTAGSLALLGAVARKD
jgi:amidase